MTATCQGQYTLFDTIADGAELVPGTWVTEYGPELTFGEITRRVGQSIIMDMSTESHAWYKAALVERIVETPEGRRLIYYDGKRQRGSMNEMYIKNRSARAYEILRRTKREDIEKLVEVETAGSIQTEHPQSRCPAYIEEIKHVSLRMFPCILY